MIIIFSIINVGCICFLNRRKGIKTCETPKTSANLTATQGWKSYMNNIILLVSAVIE